MRLDDAGPRTWLLGATTAWALVALLLAFAGMGGRIEPLPADPSLRQSLPVPAAPAPARLGPLSGYARISARPLLSPSRRPQPFSLEPEREDQPEERFEYVLTGVLLTPSLQMAIVQPARGGEPERLRVGQAPEAAPSWRLVALSPRAAVFDGPDGEQSLDLRSYDGGADLRASAVPGAAEPQPPRRGRTPAPVPMPSSPMQPDAVQDAGTSPEPEAVEEADAVSTPQEQMETIRKRIEARREQLRREARDADPPQQR